MGCGMIGANARAAGDVDAGGDLVTDRECAAGQHAHVQVQAAFLAGVRDVEQARRAFNVAAVADLAAGFCIKRRVIEHHRCLIVSADVLHRRAIPEQRLHDGLNFVVLVASEMLAPDNVCVDKIANSQTFVDMKLTGRPGPFALLRHGLLEAVQVDLQTPLAGNVRGQVDRKSVRVVQAKHGLARNALPFQALHVPFQDGQAVRQGLGEALFLLKQGGLNGSLGLRQFRVGIAHLAHQGRYQAVEERLVGAQPGTVTHGATDDASQHIATPLVTGQHAVGNQKRARADVVGNHSQRAGGQVLGADDLGRGIDQAAKNVRVVVIVHALQYGGQSRQAHADIDRGLGQPL